MIVRQKSRPAGTHPPERPRGVPAAPLPPGHARAAEVLRELRMADPREQPARVTPVRPLPALMAACGATHAACVFADTILDDLSDLAEKWIDLLEPLMASGVDHATRMLLLPVAAQLAEVAS